MGKNSILKGAVTISIGGLFAKIIGAIYRIPLTNVIGVKGIGLYQMAFPLYSILLTFSSTGVPNSLAKLIAEGKNPKSVLKESLRVFMLLGIIGSVFMFILARPLAKMQGDSLAWICYVFLSPSVLIVSIISCFRGYFQGQVNMRPTAVSQILEQVVKLIFGLGLAFIFRNNAFLSSGACVFAVTLSEVFALFYLYAKYKKVYVESVGENVRRKSIVKIVIPVTLSSILIPFARTIDSFLIINILKRYLSNPTELYGIYSGGVESVIGVPVALCYGIAVASIPIVSAQIKRGEDTTSNVVKIFTYTIILGGVFSIFLYLFSPLAVKVMYFNLSSFSKGTMIKLIKISSSSVLMLSLTQSTSAILLAKGKLYTPSVNLLVGVGCKVIFSVIFLNVSYFNIYATAISDVICFSVSALLNTIAIFKERVSFIPNKLQRIS